MYVGLLEITYAYSPLNGRLLYVTFIKFNKLRKVKKFYYRILSLEKMFLKSLSVEISWVL